MRGHGQRDRGRRHEERLTYSPDVPQQVHDLFEAVAPRYDILNTLISFGSHLRWRRFAAACADLEAASVALDLCCGTGDMAFALAETGPGCTVVGLDFAESMLVAFAARARKASPGQRRRPQPVCGDALKLPFRADSADAVTIAFGLRNIPDRMRALLEMRRVLREGSRLVILDAARPRSLLPRLLFNLHFRLVVPLLGWLFTRKWGLYSYLPASLDKYPSREELADLLGDCGFVGVRWFDLAFGAATVHVGAKPCPHRFSMR